MYHSNISTVLVTIGDCFFFVFIEWSKHFSKVQEATRKDVERAFGVLQARFGIIRGPSRMWQPSVLYLIMNACIILHNMIIEDEEDDNPDLALDFDHEVQPPRVPRNGANFRHLILARQAYRNSDHHYELRNNLVEHIWAHFKTHFDDDDLEDQ